MKCPIREKKTFRFLFWKFDVEQDHEWEDVLVGVHMPGVSDRFKRHKKCKHCRKLEIEHFVQHEDLIRDGYTPEEIEEFLSIKL